MGGESLEAFLGKTVIAESFDGIVWGGVMQRSPLAGHYQVDSGGTIHLVPKGPLKTIELAGDEEIAALNSRCSCDSDDDFRVCELHATAELRDAVRAPVDFGVCLQVPPLLFFSARTKLERAARAMLRLQREICDYRKQEPHDTDVQPARNMFFQLRLRVIKQPPDEVPALASAVIHNLRSCLDSIAWDVAKKTSSSLPEKGIYFPVVESRTALREKELTKKMHATGGPEWTAFVARVDPCPEGNELLCILHRLDIIDKHRELVRVGALASTIGIKAPAEAQAKIIGDCGLLEDGDILATFKRGYQCEVSFDVDLAIRGVERFQSVPLMNALYLLHSEVCRTLADAEKAFR